MKRLRLLALLLFAHCYILNLYPYFVNPNVASRVYLTMSIVDEGTLRIDPWLQRYATIEDKAVSGGHAYSDKPPGLAFAMVPAAFLLRHSFLRAAGVPTMIYWLRLLTLSIPCAFFWLGLLPVFEEFAAGAAGAEALVLCGALGTNHLIYATQQFGHVPIAMMLFGSFLCLRPSRRRSELPAGRAAAAGFLLSYAFITDYLALGATPALCAYALYRSAGRRWRNGAAFALGLAPPLLLWAWYNKACFGGWLDLGSFFVDEPSYRAAYQAGWHGMRAPTPVALLGMLVSPARGMLFLSPLLVLAPLGWRDLAADAKSRPDAALAAAVCSGVLLFAATTVDWMGGWAVGARYLVPALPFLLIGAAGALRRARERSFYGTVWCGLALPGLFWAGAAALSFPQFPNQFLNPLAHFALPLLGRGCLTRNWLSPSIGAWSAAPFLAAIAAAGWRVLDLVGRISPRMKRAPALAFAAALVLLQCLIPEPAAHAASRARAMAAVAWDMGCRAP